MTSSACFCNVPRQNWSSTCLQHGPGSKHTPLGLPAGNHRKFNMAVPGHASNQTQPCSDHFNLHCSIRQSKRRKLLKGLTVVGQKLHPSAQQPPLRRNTAADLVILAKHHLPWPRLERRLPRSCAAFSATASMSSFSSSLSQQCRGHEFDAKNCSSQKS